MTVAFTEFLPEVLPHLPGCSDILAVNAIRNATIEFCTDTLYWQEVQDSVNLTASSFPYPLDFPSGAQAVTALSVTVGGVLIGQTTQDELDRMVVSWRTATGVPQAYFQYDTATIGVYPAPLVSAAYIMRVAIAPSRTSAGVIDFIYNKHLEAIASGALARLFSLPGEPWSDAAKGDYHKAAFESWKQQGVVEANKSYLRVPARLK